MLKYAREIWEINGENRAVRWAYAVWWMELTEPKVLLEFP